MERWCRNRMKLHPLLDDPLAVLISYTAVPEPPDNVHFVSAAWQALAAMQIELDGEKAVLKPNLTAAERFADPGSGIGTHPAFLQGMAEYLAGHGARRGGIYLLEDPRNSDDNRPRHWQGTGCLEVAAATGIKLRCPNGYSCVKKAVLRPLAHTALHVSRLAVAPDVVLFNVPKLKTHNLGITTLCLKNLMGTVHVLERHFCGQAWREMPEPARSDRRPRNEWLDRALHERWQEGLARRLVDTAQVVKPRINLVEGVVGREGTGFQRGRNRSLGLVVGGTNMVAVDSIASYLMGFDPLRLIYLRVAAEAGLGTNDPRALRIYLAHEGAPVPCSDLEALRVQPPMQVISNIVGEDPNLFS